MLSMHEVQGSIPCASTFFLVYYITIAEREKQRKERGGNFQHLSLKKNSRLYHPEAKDLK